MNLEKIGDQICLTFFPKNRKNHYLILFKNNLYLNQIYLYNTLRDN